MIFKILQKERIKLSDRISPESATINALRERLEKHGYKLYGITHFSNHDRINFGNKNVKISMNLRSKIAEIAFDALVEACIGKEGKTQ
jgi:coproporphyrinogen III oxidase-like Fe-S oxidoreductase